MSDFDLRFKSALNLTHPIDLVFGNGGAATENKAVLSATIDAPTLNAVGIALRNAHLVSSINSPTLNSSVVASSVAVLSDTIDPPTANVISIHRHEVILSAEIDAPTLLSVVAIEHDIVLTATIEPPECVAVAEYDNAVFRGLSSVNESGWNTTNKLDVYREAKTQRPANIKSHVTSGSAEATSIHHSSAISIQNAMSLKAKALMQWNDATQIASSAESDFMHLALLRSHVGVVWELGSVAHCSSAIEYDELLRKPRTANSRGWSYGVVRQRTLDSSYHVAKRRQVNSTAHWSETARPNYGKSVRPVVPPDDNNYKPANGTNVFFVFNEKATTDTNVLFGIRQFVPAKKIIPVKRTYAVINDIQLRRVEGNHVLPDVALSMSIDMDSWTWSFSASMPASAISLVEPSVLGEAVQLEAMINGQPYLLLAEGIQRDRVFGKSSIAVTGRGQSAMLTDPYSPSLSFRNETERSAQQLMQDVLQTNGVSLGWAIDWRIDDWLVPAGAWSHQGTYMSACTAIAAAAGAFIQPDPINKVLRVRSRVPFKPWDMANVSADIELPLAAVLKESVTWSDRPAYNAIFISGSTNGGINGHVKRAGTAGDIVAPMIVDPLISSAIAARQRGIVELAKSGRSAVYSVSLPILDDVGVIEPGTVLQYVDANNLIGVVTGVSVNAQLPKVRQTVEMQIYG